MKKLKHFILILVVVFTSYSFTLHKYYISLTEINYNAKEKALQIEMRFFIDDMETVIFGEKVRRAFVLDTPDEPKNINALFDNILKENFEIKVNNESLNYMFLGKEYEGDMVFLYIEITDIENISSIEVKNQMLVSAFPTQQNYIKVKIGKTFKSLLLTKSEKSGVLKF